MFLPLRGRPELNVCRDGGSITASYTDFWGNDYLLTLPVRLTGTSKDDVKMVGYKSPILEKVVKSKRISKGNGARYTLSSMVEVAVDKEHALKIARKIQRSVSGRENLDIATDLVLGI
ncbi:hypothetical protein C7H09_17085 [Marinobacter fuscus]|uniref:Uncharacterized protein n=1 Tax=Marinobacter fuscus TaxID=2109942 RepID=A0A2T1K5J8_9GAMM|nr:hypothetical protein C7H09_17085 [Marinobacter fuscus]